MKQGWEIVKLPEVVFFQEGPGLRKFQYTETGVPFLNIRTLVNDKVDKSLCGHLSETEVNAKYQHFLLNEGDIICSTSGTIGKLAIVHALDLPLMLNTSVIRFRELDKKIVFRNFIYYYLKSDLFLSQAKDAAKGQAQVNFGPSHLKQFDFILPPLSEQKRIVAILDEAFTSIEKAKSNAEQNLKNSKDFFESYLQRVFDSKGDNWEEKLLGEFAIFRNGINYTKGSKGEKIKIVGVKDFQDSYWVPDNDLVEVSLDGKINETDLLKEGDILAVRSNGNPQLIGRTLLAGKINEKVSHSGFTIRIRLNSKIVNPNYLCHFLKTQQTRKTLVESGNGVGIKSLNQGSLSSLKIPFPKSLKEQEMIIDKVESIEEQSQKLKDIYQRKINDLEELKKSILQKAFAGELK